jgi:hypothetical protein
LQGTTTAVLVKVETGHVNGQNMEQHINSFSIDKFCGQAQVLLNVENMPIGESEGYGPIAVEANRLIGVSTARINYIVSFE